MQALRAILQRLVDQVRNHLGVRLTGELASPCAKLIFELHVVLDDAVMRHHHLARAMRVRVELSWPPVRRPARMTQTDAAVKRLAMERRLQTRQLPLSAADPDLALVIGDRNARRVVAPVLQLTQSAEQNVTARLLPNIPHDSTHRTLAL